MARGARRQKPYVVEQRTPRRIEPRMPGGGTPLLHGVRVVEVANTIAVPMLARQLAELGAEVIKVEPVGEFLFE